MNNFDISIIMPCLNEENTVGLCVRSALDIIFKMGITGEVLVVDNGSNDESVHIAKKAGARVVMEQRRGYGLALRRGIRSARGDVMILIDADTTYDFRDIPKMYYPMAFGKADVIIGDRFAGGMSEGAMSLTHRIGVRVLSFLGRLRFESSVRDFHCGLRGLTRKAAGKMRFHTDGMEFATEMIAEAERRKLKIGQVPVSLRMCRYERVSKLKTIRDGLRHLLYIICGF